MSKRPQPWTYRRSSAKHIKTRSCDSHSVQEQSLTSITGKPSGSGLKDITSDQITVITTDPNWLLSYEVLDYPPTEQVCIPSWMSRLVPSQLGSITCTQCPGIACTHYPTSFGYYCTLPSTRPIEQVGQEKSLTEQWQSEADQSGTTQPLLDDQDQDQVVVVPSNQVWDVQL